MYFIAGKDKDEMISSYLIANFVQLVSQALICYILYPLTRDANAEEEAFLDSLTEPDVEEIDNEFLAQARLYMLFQKRKYGSVRQSDKEKEPIDYDQPNERKLT
jgi:hypothetical protein